MRPIARALLASAALAMAWGCGGSDEPTPTPAPTFQELLQGAWSMCKASSGTSNFDILTFSGVNVTVTSDAFPNETCTGTGTPQTPKSGTVVIGSTVTAALGSASVTATRLDITIGGPTQYNLAYIDTAATPDRMYMGDTSGANDGSTPELRPVSLDDSRFFTRQ